MNRRPSTRPPWLPGAALLAAAAGVSALLGLAIGARGFWAYLVLAAGVLLAVGWLERTRARRVEAPPPRARGKLKVIKGGKAAPYDLEKDDSTDGQRYLM
jgi:hypothetical protein